MAGQGYGFHPLDEGYGQRPEQLLGPNHLSMLELGEQLLMAEQLATGSVPAPRGPISAFGPGRGERVFGGGAEGRNREYASLGIAATRRNPENLTQGPTTSPLQDDIFLRSLPRQGSMPTRGRRTRQAETRRREQDQVASLYQFLGQGTPVHHGWAGPAAAYQPASSFFNQPFTTHSGDPNCSCNSRDSSSLPLTRDGTARWCPSCGRRCMIGLFG